MLPRRRIDRFAGDDATSGDTMNRTALLAATALSTVACGTALADGGNGKRLTGLGQFAYGYTDFELDNGFGGTADNFRGDGAALWTWDNEFNLQGGFGFNTDRYDFDGGEHSTTDLWKVGVAGFWRDPNKYAIGAELDYASVTQGDYADGVRFGGFGEYYDQQFTLGGRLGYLTLEGNDFNYKIDGWDAGAYGKFYAEPNLGLKLGLTYNDHEYWSSENQAWWLDGEAEYLIPDCTTSIFANLGYGTQPHFSTKSNRPPTPAASRAKN
jgi:hypothetical protein